MKSILFVVLLCCLPSLAANYSVVRSGDWSDPGTWGASAAPGSGDIVTCSGAFTITVSSDTIVGNSPANGNVITQSADCTIALGANVTLVVQGGWNKLGAVRRASGAIIKFDSSGAASPRSTPYTLSDGGIWTDDGNDPPTAANRFTITANTSGSNWLWTNLTAGSGITGMTNALLQYCGDPGGAKYCLDYHPGGRGTVAIGAAGAPVVFDHSCGVKWDTGSTNNDGWNFTRVSFENTYPACTPWYAQTGNGTPANGITRSFDTVVFDQRPRIETHGAIYTNSIFLKGYADLDVFGGYGVISRSLIVANFQGAAPLTWDESSNVPIQNFTIDHDLVLGDPTTTLVNGTPTAQTPLSSGTVTAASSGAASSSLTDAAQSWPVHAYKTGGYGTYMVVITAGTGAGQARIVYDNTANKLTVLSNWDVTPDPSSSYAIYVGVINPHWTDAASLAPGVSIQLSYNIFGLFTGADNQGDVYHAVNAIANSANCNLWRGPWSPTIAYATGSGVSEGGVYYRSITTTTNNDPATDGGAHWLVSTLAALDSRCGAYELDYNLVLPNAAHDNSGTFLTGGTAAYRANHNTYFTGAQSAAFDESRPGAFPGGFLSFEGNLAWAEPGKTYVPTAGGLRASSFGPFLVDDSGGSIAHAFVMDFANNTCFGGGASCADYNGGYGLLTTGYCAAANGSNQGGSGAYNSQCTAPMGTHDVTGDPQFVNRWATPQTWIQSLGMDTNLYDPVAIMPDVYKQMMKVNDSTGFDSRFTVAALYAYLSNAFSPQNSAFHNAAADGTDIGAVPYSAPGPTLVSIAVAPAAASIAVGATQAFSATGTFSDGSTADLTNSAAWASSNIPVATISSSGIASGNSAGITNITAAQNAIASNTAALTVNGGAPTLLSITVTPNPVTIVGGATQQFTAIGNYSDASTVDLTATATWSSSAPTVASIAAGGLATGVAPGSTNISAVYESITSNNAVLNVKVLTAITVSPAMATKQVGATQAYSALGTYSDGSTGDMTALCLFNSSNPLVATVSGATATALRTGISNITASAFGVTSPASVLRVFSAKIGELGAWPERGTDGDSHGIVDRR